jgi:hypothetical protein
MHMLHANKPSRQPIRPSVCHFVETTRRPPVTTRPRTHGDRRCSRTAIASPSRQAPVASRRPGRLDCHSAKAVVATGKRQYAAAPVRRSALLQVSLHLAHGSSPISIRHSGLLHLFQLVPVVPGEWRLSASELPQISH